MKSLILLCLTLFLLTACETIREEVRPAELGSQSGKLVVDCFISPQDTLLTAKVTRSRPVLDADPLQSVEITNAVVTLAGENRSVTLVYDARLKYYAAAVAKLPIRAGIAYTLTVRTPDGKQVRAVSTVPQAVALKTVRLDSSLVTEAGKVPQKRFSVVCTWQDPGAVANFYQVQGGVRGIQRGLPANAPYGNPDAILFRMPTNNSGLLQDKGVNASASASAFLWDEAGSAARKKQNRSTLITVSLLHVDETYYRTYEALERQLQASTNPFAEPVPIPNNIEGGLGFFGSYNRSTLTVKL